MARWMHPLLREDKVQSDVPSTPDRNADIQTFRVPYSYDNKLPLELRRVLSGKVLVQYKYSKVTRPVYCTVLVNNGGQLALESREAAV